jgi:hypothetical protein
LTIFNAFKPIKSPATQQHLTQATERFMAKRKAFYGKTQNRENGILLKKESICRNFLQVSQRFRTFAAY